MHSSPSRQPLVWAALLACFGLALAWGAAALPLHAVKLRQAVKQNTSALHSSGQSRHARSATAVAYASGVEGGPRTRTPHQDGGLKAMAAGAAPPTAIPLYTFPGKPGGSYPQARLTPGSDGNFYGVTNQGGDFDFGTAFRMTPNGTVTQLASFGKDSSIGHHPAGPLVEGQNPDGSSTGAFYGVTTDGGDNGKGTVYLFAPDAGSPTGYSITTLYSFTGGADGGAPQGALILGHKADGSPDGYLYGATPQGGNTGSSDTIGAGVIFRISPGGAEDTLYAFPVKDGDGINQGGSSPNGGLVQLQSTGRGDLLGTAANGGTQGKGTVFDLTPAGQLVTLHDFQPTNSDGQHPMAGLTSDGAGSFYGTTFVGGPQGQQGSGTVFLIFPNPNGPGYVYTPYVLLGPDNAGPTDSLLVAADGQIYGTSSFGGGQYGGTVFVLGSDPNNPTAIKANALHTFNSSATEGSYILAGVTQGADGDLYGVASASGSAGYGTIFRLNTGTTGPAPAPTITPPIGYQANADGTATVTINGANFQSGVVVFVGSVQPGTTLSASYVSSSQLVATVSKPLPDGDHTVTVTNPDNQAASATLTTGGPRITSMDYRVVFHDPSRATSTITVNGAGFVDKPGANVTNVRTGTGLTLTFVSAAQVVLNLDNTLPSGKHDVTVTNSDGTSAKATLTTYDGPQITPPVGFQYSGNANAALVVDGTSFVRGGTLTVSNTAGTSMSVSLNGSPDPVGTEYTALFTGLMPAGDHVITITNPDGLFTTTTFTTYGIPEINVVNYHLNPSTNTSTVTVTGNHFVRGGGFSIGNTFTGTTINFTINNAPSPEGFQIDAQLSKPLPTGDHLVTFTDPDGRKATKTFTTYSEKGPNITNLKPIANADGSSDLLITGTNFVHTPSVTVTNTTSGTSASVTADNATSITVHLTKVLPLGAHDVKVTNPDGQSATGRLTTYGKPRVDGAVAITQPDGTVRMVVSGVDFYPGGYNGDVSGATVIVRAPSGAVVPSRILAGPGVPANIGDPQQITLSLGNARNGQNYSVEVDNSDGQTSRVGALAVRAFAAGQARPEAQSAGSTNFNVYTSNQTQYQAGFLAKILAFFHLQFLLQPSGNASPTQLLPGNVSLINEHPCLLVPAGPGSIVVGLVASGGGNLVASGGGNVISNDGGSLVAQGGGNLISQDGGGLVAQGGGNLISQDGGGLISQDGGGLVASGGGNVLPITGLVAPVGSAAGLGGKLDVSTLVASGGGNLSGHAQSGDAALRAMAEGAMDAPPSGAPLSFSLTRFDQGAENGTGSTDGLVIGRGPDGKDILILRIRFTPDQPDVVTYAAPGLTLTAVNGTPAPQVENPVPTLETITPNGVTAGGGSFTLSVTGTLFEDGTVVTWNGQPLATTVVSGTQATAQVPASLIAAPGTAQVTVATPAPGGGTSNALPFTVAAAPPPAAVLHTYPAGLQMFSAPEDFSGVSNDVALGTVGVKLAVWDSAIMQYALSPAPPADALRLGQGYWARFANDTPLYDLGKPAPTTAPFAVALQPGWNMIGDPFPAAVPLSALTVVDAGGGRHTLDDANRRGLVSRTMYGFPAGARAYQALSEPSGTLAPYQGYWVHAIRACTLLIPPPGVSR